MELYRLFCFDLGTIFNCQVVQVDGICFTAGSVCQNYVPDSVIGQGQVQRVVDLCIGNIVLCADLMKSVGSETR